MMTTPIKTDPLVGEPWVIIPTYNEKDNIQKLIPRLFKLGIPNLHVLIVDDNSPDQTGYQVKEFQSSYSSLHLLNRPRKQGLGRAYIAGFKFALDHGAGAIVQMDADFSHDPNDVPRLITNLTRADLVIGSRYIHGISVINWPLKRLLISMAANFYARFITRLPIQDTTGGFRAWRSSALKSINFAAIKADGYGFQVATLYYAWKKDLTFAEIPIVFTERREGQSKMNRQIIWEAFFLVWKLRLLD